MRNITLHTLATVPYSNLNRDGNNAPKRTKIGGQTRGLLSSQSIKRGIRLMYEEAALANGSLAGVDVHTVRSKNHVATIVKRAMDINPALNEKKLGIAVKKRVEILFKKAGEAKEDVTEEAGEEKATADPTKAKEKDAALWLSSEEIEKAAQSFAAGNDEPILSSPRTGSLSIAAFGRMFANSDGFNTEAAIAVSPAIAVHQTVIEDDWYSTAEDNPTEAQGRGAAHLGSQGYTSGVFYRSVTIDKAQLKTSWSGFTSDTAREQLAIMVESIVFGMPSGKKNSTAPYVAPLMVVAEEQRHRFAYDFEAPVKMDNDGGFSKNAVDNLNLQRKAIKDFCPTNTGRTVVTGTTVNGNGLATQNDLINEAKPLDVFIETIVDWIIE